MVVFPNPAEDNLYISCPSTGSLVLQIELIGIQGKIISSWNEVAASGRIMLDIHEIPSGIYLLRMKYGEEQVTHKVSIVNR